MATDRCANDSNGDITLAARRPERRVRWVCVIAAAAAALLVGLPAVSGYAPRPVLLWNASPSSTIGLYLVRSPTTLKRGAIVVAFTNEPARRLAAARGYVPHDVPLVKAVAAIAPDRVCADGASIFVNRRRVAKRLRRDPLGRLLPWWAGCRTLEAGEVFLLNAHVPLAFDGRYFGVTGKSQIIGEARLLWPHG